MKKLLKLAAFAMMTIAAVPSVKAEFAPTAYKPYYLKLNGTEKYINVEVATPDHNDSASKNAGMSTTPIPVFFIPGSTAGQFAIGSCVTGKYLTADSPKYWNSSIVNDSPYYWAVSETEQGTLHFAQNNDANRNIGTQIRTGVNPDCVYCDNATNASDALIDWVLEECNDEVTDTYVNYVTASYEFDGSQFFSKSAWILNGMNLSEVLPQAYHFFNVTEDAVAQAGTSVYSIHGELTHSLVMSSDLDHPNYMLIKNLRTENQYRPADRHGVSYAATPGSSGKLTLKTTSELNVEDRYDIGAIWYFKRAGEMDEEGYFPVNIYNAYTNQAIANVINGVWATTGDDIVWYLNENEQDNFSGFNILHAKDVTSNSYGWNNSGNTSRVIEYWAGNDPGSIWGVEVADADKLAATLNEINAALVTERKTYVDRINEYVENGLFDFTEEQQIAWNAAATASIGNQNQFNSYMSVLHQQVSDAFANSVTDGHDWNLQFSHEKDPAYIGYTATGVKRGGNEGTRTFTLKNAEDGTGFYIFHEYSNKYIKQPTSADTNISLVKEMSEASIYNFDLSNVNKGLVGIKVVGPTDHVNSTYPYLHSNNSNDVVRWEKGDYSAWYLHFVDENQAAAEYLAGAIHNSETELETVDIVGFLQVGDIAAVEAAIAAANALGDDASSTEKRESANAIYAAVTQKGALNEPKHGEIYTLTACDNRGTLYYNAEKGDFIWTTGKTAKPADAAENVNQWIVYKDGENTYLYNVAAQKFANAFGLKSHKDLSNVKYAWMFGDVPTPVVINGNIFEQPANATRPFVIEGGEDTSDRHRPGMMIINGIDTDMTPVIAIAGWSSNQDGSGFNFVKVGVASDEDMANIAAAIANMDANAAEAKEAADALIDSERSAEELSSIVGYYTLEDINKYNETMGLIAEDSSADKVYGLSVSAMKGIENATISCEMTDGFVYTIETSEGLKYHGVTGVASTASFNTQEGEDHANAYNWRATVEGDAVRLTHTNNTNKVKFLVSNSEIFTVSAGSKVGQVILTPYAGTSETEPAAMSDEEVAPAAEYVLTSLGADAGDSTTGIEEVTAVGAEGVQTVYDLQGRRLSAPVKGINIINGKKVLVK